MPSPFTATYRNPNKNSRKHNQMEVSWNRGIPSHHPFTDGFSHEINHPAMGVPLFQETSKEGKTPQLPWKNWAPRRHHMSTIMRRGCHEAPGRSGSRVWITEKVWITWNILKGFLTQLGHWPKCLSSGFKFINACCNSPLRAPDVAFSCLFCDFTDGPEED